MKNINDLCVVVQSRLNSERVPRKMIRPFGGISLFENVINIIQKTKLAKNNFYVSVYEQELKDIAKNKGVEIFHRSEKSAESEAISVKELFEWWDKLPFIYVIVINGCCPFLKPETIDNFIETYLKSDSDGMFGVIEKRNYYWNKIGELITNWPNDEGLNTKRVEITYEAAHCLYASRLDIIRKNMWMGDLNTIRIYPMNDFEAFDIDHKWQFDMAEAMFRKMYF